MIKDTDCFKQIGESKFIQKYFESQNKNELDTLDHYGFNVHILPLDIVLEEPLIRKLHRKFIIKKVGFIKMDNNSCYRWHIDVDRKVAINMLLTPDIHCYTLFGERDDAEGANVYETVELKYKPNLLYLFNTEIPHTVINFDSTRWLFTVEFGPNVTYEDISRELSI